VSAALLLAAILAQAPAPEEERPLESWTCTVSERLGDHVGGMLQMVVDPDGTRHPPSLHVHWSTKPGYMGLQSMSWIGIPLDATRLWKPDEIELSMKGERTDEAGSVIFQSPKHGRILRSADRLARSLRPHFELTWVKIEEAYLISQLWSGWPWTAEHSDSKGVTLGSQAILLPGPDESQAMFDRLRIRLAEHAADPAAKCQANLGPTRRELEESQVLRATPIPRPDLSSPGPQR
jgi:hypothetical protein